jgi:catechol 2,3-dioxygenase-like lactoylglutathione lyase family enzyme
MITGAHVIIYSTDPAADRAFLRDVLKFPHVDAGEGWLIFGLPPAELAVHPSDQNDRQELFLICDDIHAFVLEMAHHNIQVGQIQEQNWGHIVYITLPGGGRLGVYQPSHARPDVLKTSGGRDKLTE